MDLRRRSRQTAPRPMRAMRATPPTTPPTIAPTGVDLLLVGSGASELVVVSVCSSVSLAWPAELPSELIVVAPSDSEAMPSLRVLVLKLAFFWPLYVKSTDCGFPTGVDAQR